MKSLFAPLPKCAMESPHFITRRLGFMPTGPRRSVPAAVCDVPNRCVCVRALGAVGTDQLGLSWTSGFGLECTCFPRKLHIGEHFQSQVRYPTQGHGDCVSAPPPSHPCYENPKPHHCSPHLGCTQTMGGQYVCFNINACVRILPSHSLCVQSKNAHLRIFLDSQTNAQVRVFWAWDSTGM